MSKQNLVLCLISLHHNGSGHPTEAMKDLGITYQFGTPQSMMDSWWFWNCENVPDPLPDYLHTLKRTPDQAVGWGLSKEQAEQINKEAE